MDRRADSPPRRDADTPRGSPWSTAARSVDALQQLEQPEGDDDDLTPPSAELRDLLSEWPDSAEEDVDDDDDDQDQLEGLPADDDVLDLIVLDLDDDDLDDDDTPAEAELPPAASPLPPSSEAMVNGNTASPGHEYYAGLGKRLEQFAPRATLDPDNQTQMMHRLAVIERFRVHNAAQVGGNAGAAALARQDSGPPICRICRDTAPDGVEEAREDGAEDGVEDEDRVVGAGAAGALVSPCECRGTVARVHMSCLERWLAESDSSCCELCGHQYTTVRTPSYGLLASIPAWMVLNGSAELLFDIVAFFIFTPVTMFGTHLGLGVDDAPYFQVSIMAALDLVYSAWLAMRLHYHANRWYAWWRRKSTVKVILDKEEKNSS